MRRFIYSTAFLLMWFAVPTSRDGRGDAQANQIQPADIKIDRDIDAESEPLELILSGLLHGTGLYGGFASSTSCSELPTGRIHFQRGGNLRQAMDSLVEANPGYRWETNGSVLNLMPSSGIAILDTMISSFHVDATDLEIRALPGELMRLAEVRKALAAQGLQPSVGQEVESVPAPIHITPRQPVPIHLDLHNVSLREALNRIAELSPGSVWSYRENDCNSVKHFAVTIKLDRR